MERRIGILKGRIKAVTWYDVDGLYSVSRQVTQGYTVTNPFYGGHTKLQFLMLLNLSKTNRYYN